MRTVSAPIPCWTGDGQYRVNVVGESYAREVLAEIAQNPKGKSALVFCTATLVPEPNNPFDHNAVAIEVLGRVVGHLPREDAASYMDRLRSREMISEKVAVQAVVTGGLVTDERSYDYSVELDIDPAWVLQREVTEPSTAVVRADAESLLHPESSVLWSAKVWLPAPRNELCSDLSVETWTTAKWDQVNFYVLNRQRIGLGFRLIGVPKVWYAERFAEHELGLSLQAIGGRWAVLKVQIIGPGLIGDA